MSSFKPGWHEVHFDAKTRRHSWRLFTSTSSCTAEMIIEPDGTRRLIWADPKGLDGPGKQVAWAESFRFMPQYERDWWNAIPGGEGYRPKLPADHSRADRKPTARELCQRASNGSLPSGLECSNEIHVGIFHDGTNNNRVRDQPTFNHTNIVSLYDVHKDDRKSFFKYYIPGVGTKFEILGEMTESRGGKAFCGGGEARIHYSMLQVYNAVAVAATGKELITDDEAGLLCTDTDLLATSWRLFDGKW